MLSGATVISLEIAWERVGRFAVGNRALAVAAVLAIVLAMLALASFAVPRLSAAARRIGLGTDTALGAVLLGASALLLFAAWAGTRLALSPSPSDFRALLEFSACAAPAFFAVGLVFPWLLASRPATGRAVGTLYAVNGAGTLAGTAGTTFVLLPLVGTAGVLQVCALALLVSGAGLAVFPRRNVLTALPSPSVRSRCFSGRCRSHRPSRGSRFWNLRRTSTGRTGSSGTRVDFSTPAPITFVCRDPTERPTPPTCRCSSKRSRGAERTAC